MSNEKTEVTKLERMQLMGLLLLAKEHNDRLSEIHEAVTVLTGETTRCDQCSDAVYSGSFNADDLLRKLNLTVKA